MRAANSSTLHELRVDRPTPRKVGGTFWRIEMSKDVPYPAPAGYEWIFVTQYRHWRTKQIIRAVNYGQKAFCLLVKSKSS